MHKVAILLSYPHQSQEYVLLDPNTNNFYFVPFDENEVCISDVDLIAMKFVTDSNGPVRSEQTPTITSETSFYSNEDRIYAVRVCGDCIKFPSKKFVNSEHWVKKEEAQARVCKSSYEYKRLMAILFPDKPQKTKYFALEL